MAVTPRKATRRARALRQAETPAERRLWSCLRNRGLSGLKFVRQEPVGPFIVDFICREAMLAIEVDGATHSTEVEIADDRRREAFMRQEGLYVLRFSNDDVYRTLDDVLETIIARSKNPG